MLEWAEWECGGNQHRLLPTKPRGKRILGKRRRLRREHRARRDVTDFMPGYRLSCTSARSRRTETVMVWTCGLKCRNKMKKMKKNTIQRTFVTRIISS